MSSQHPLIELLHISSQAFHDLMSTNIVDLITNAPQTYANWWLSLYHSSPNHVIVETGLILFILWLWFIRPTVNPQKLRTESTKLTKGEIDDLVAEWQPEPLVPALSEDEQALANNMKVVEAYDGLYVQVRGYAKPALNLAAFDFLGMSLYPPLKEASRAALEKYGCGSCGPRGFYGTIDVHLKFEEAMAALFGTEEAISYSDGPSTVSSAIPAFAKKGDIILADECVHEAVRTGISLSRATVKFFRHNDMAHLDSLMKQIQEGDKRNPRAKEEQRRFIVVEGLYRNKGDLCPLPKIMELKNKYCYRLIVDESYSFGSIGASGLGAHDHFRIPRKDIDILTVSMENSLGTVGGVCIGSREVVDHQRLSGAGYCFSASAPPFLSAAALAALDRMKSKPELFRQLSDNTRRFISKLKAQGRGIRIESDEISAIVMIAPTDCGDLDERARMRLVTAFAEDCLRRGVFVGIQRFTGDDDTPVEADYFSPTLRVCITAALTPEQIDEAVAAICEARASLVC